MTTEGKHHITERSMGLVRNLGRSTIDGFQASAIGGIVYAAINGGHDSLPVAGTFATIFSAYTFFTERQARMKLLSQEERTRQIHGLKKAAYTAYDVKPVSFGIHQGIEYNRSGDRQRAAVLLQESLTYFPDLVEGDKDYNSIIIPLSDIDYATEKDPDRMRMEPKIMATYSSRIQGADITLRFLKGERANVKDSRGQEVSAIVDIEDRITWSLGHSDKHLAVIAHSARILPDYPQHNSRIRAISIDELTRLQQSILDKIPQ